MFWETLLEGSWDLVTTCGCASNLSSARVSPVRKM